ncbi:MAG: hypothetical protein H7Y88_02420 [Phycisphaerales bacterium]|nr:hypothetical protein [Phycisphaerales bacterium]
MARCRVDSSIKRVEMDGMAFPLGVFPVEAMKPRQGYTVWFEPADGDERSEDGEWEEWPDRYVFDIAITATRLEPLVRALFSMLPGRVYPILDVLGHDAYREVDPYVSYELIGQERIVDALRRFRAFFFEDGLVGFGAMSEQPFVYVFVDEHKLVTVRAEADLKEKVESLLAAFDLEVVEEIAGADAASHEHRSVLEAPENRPDLLSADEIVEELRDDWGLVLNVDAEKNVDEEGNDLGITGWRCLIRWESPSKAPPEPELPEDGAEPAAPKEPATTDDLGEEASIPTLWITRRYAEVVLTARNLTEAEVLAQEAVREQAPDDEQDEGDPVTLSLDRTTPEELGILVGELRGVPVRMDAEKVWAARWLE